MNHHSVLLPHTNESSNSSNVEEKARNGVTELDYCVGLHSSARTVMPESVTALLRSHGETGEIFEKRATQVPIRRTLKQEEKKCAIWMRHIPASFAVLP